MKVGILGGGQLGLMLAEAISRLDRQVTVLDSDPVAPVAARLAQVITARYDDPEALATLFEGARSVTFDSENIPVEPLRPFAEKLVPGVAVLETCQHRISEKAFLADEGFPTVRHRAVKLGADVRAAAVDFGFPCIAKSALGGYDGKSQFRLQSEADLSRLPANSKGGWVLEEVFSLDTELSCIVARDADGEGFSFPVFENLHHEHVLDLTVFPARVDAGVQAEAEAVARAIAAKLGVVGLLTVEFFYGAGADGVKKLVVNELAPRTHNSGHVTRQACTFSQFDALARILSGVPLGKPQVHSGAWCMGNLLGDVWRAQDRGGGPLDLSAWAGFPEVTEVFLYGKAEARPRRKMGHFVVRGSSPEAAMKTARAFRAALMGES
jgi:5-(carboxyamino)imidazole ribonucleotide synthase